VTSTLAAGSYQIASSTGTYTDTYTGAANQNWSMIIAGFKPATTTGATTTYIVHTDHLGGTNVVTDNNGDVVQTVDYYPHGSQRINTKAGSFHEKRKFTGHEYDSAVGLTYMKARYYDGNRGGVTSTGCQV
jgi:hypothetical protein